MVTLPTPSNIIWTQAERETPMEQERRAVLQAEAAVKALWAIYDAELETLRHRAPRMFGRVPARLSGALTQAQTLLETYDYFLARYAEAGLSPEDAAAAWE
jgi:hypothetical protein